MRRQDDPRPVTAPSIDDYGCGQPGESLAEYVDRMILHRPTSRLRHVWGWPPPPRFFEPSYVQSVNLRIQER